jgi:CHAT domain-containing protein
MADDRTTAFWRAVAGARNGVGLAEALSGEPVVARAALAELLDLLGELDPLPASHAVDRLRQLGVQIAATIGDRTVQARLQAQLHRVEALEAIRIGDRQSAERLLTEHARETLDAGDLTETVRASHFSTLFLLRLGLHDRALAVAEALLDAVERMELAHAETSIALYEFAHVARLAPATPAWAVLLTRLRGVLHSGGETLMANAVASRLAVLLVRMGALEAGLEMLADVLSALARTAAQLASGEVKEIPEANLARLWRARALDLLGREEDAEEAYRAHPAWTAGNAEDRAEMITRLAELLLENDRVQEMLDLLGTESLENTASQALGAALASVGYARVNRMVASDAAAEQARAIREAVPADPAGASELERLTKAGVRDFEKAFAPGEIEWRVRLVLTEGAAILGRLGDADAARVHEGLAWARMAGERALEARWLRLAAEIDVVADDLERAVTLLEEALECELTGGVREWKQLGGESADPFPIEVAVEQVRRARLEAGVGMETLLAIGRLRAALDRDPADAWNTAIAAARRRNRRLTLYSGLASRARWLERQGRRDEARREWETAVDVLETLRVGLRDLESQIGLLQDREEAYGELLEMFADSADASSAVRLMERAKSRALLEELSSDVHHAPLGPEPEEHARALRQQLVRALRRMSGHDAAEAESARAEWRLLKDRLAAVYRSTSRSDDKLRLPGARAEDVARLSADGVAVLHYFVAEECVVFAGARDGTLQPPLRLPCSRATLEDILESLRFEISTGERCHSLEALYAAVVKPVEPLIAGARQIIVMPHGPLHAAPLHAAMAPDGRYLVDSADVWYAPSAAVALRTGRAWSAVPGGAESLLMSASSTPYCVLPPLEAADHEVAAAAEVVPGARVLAGRDAVRRHILRLQGDISLLHLASHAEFDADDPLLSPLYLADAPLYAYEVQRLRCRPRLVVLSACETAVQRRAAGDETFGLVRAFLSLGAEAVVASLWTVADESTAILMRAFHQRLANGKADVAAALGAAQRELRSTTRYAHPYFWAPYVAIGGSGLDREVKNAGVD